MRQAKPLALAFPMLPGLLFLVAAGVHRADLPGAGYTTSPLIAVEFALMVVTACALIVQMPVLVALAVHGGWRWLVASLLGWALGFGLLIAGVMLDSPTLIYMT